MISHLSGLQICNDPAQLNQLLALDRLNMEPILIASGFPDFPIEKRIANLRHESTEFFGAFESGVLVGYLELRRDWKDPSNIYLSSIQIHPSKQGTMLFKVLVRSAHGWLCRQNFNLLTTNVQIANRRMLKILSRLGFVVGEGINPNSKLMSGDLKKISTSKLFKSLVTR